MSPPHHPQCHSWNSNILKLPIMFLISTQQLTKSNSEVGLQSFTCFVNFCFCSRQCCTCCVCNSYCHCSCCSGINGCCGQILPLTAAAAATLFCGPVTPFCSNGFVVTSLLKTIWLCPVDHLLHQVVKYFSHLVAVCSPSQFATKKNNKEVI
jgi:hypothetical protein